MSLEKLELRRGNFILSQKQKDQIRQKFEIQDKINDEIKAKEIIKMRQEFMKEYDVRMQKKLQRKIDLGTNLD